MMAPSTTSAARPSDAEVERLFAMIDADGDGQVTMAEWQAGYAKAQADFGGLMTQMRTAMAKARSLAP